MGICSETEEYIYKEDDAIIFETDYLYYKIGIDGRNREFTFKPSGKNYLAFSSYFMSVKKDDKWIYSSDVDLVDGFLNITFGDSGVLARIHPRSIRQSHYLTFELIHVNDHSISSLRLVDLSLTITETVSHNITSCRNAEFGVVVIPLNIETTASPVRSPGARLRSWCESSVRLEGAKVAVSGVPTDKLLDTIEQIEIENGLPHPTIEGVWSRKSPDQLKSYLFVDLSEAIVDDMIAYAKAGGFGYITIYTGVWNKTHGTYLVNDYNFPNGEEGLKATIKKIHDAGLKVGMHVLDAIISKDDPMVKNEPSNPGFIKYPHLKRILGKDIGRWTSFIQTTESPEGYLTYTDKSRFHGRDILIDDEIIVYSDIKTDEPFGFTGCSRGAHGSGAAAHDAGASIENFCEFIGFYIPDLKSELYDRVTAGEANALDSYEFDYIYPDGIGENMGYYPEGPRWYIMNLLMSKLYNKTNREILWGHVPISNYSWHIFSRGNTTDFVMTGIIEHFDKVSIANSSYYIDDLQPFEFGWFGYFTKSAASEATRPREMEYAWSKALAYGAAMSLETNKAALDANGRTEEIFGIIKNWEDLKMRGHFSESLKEKMREPGKEFTLDKDNDGNWIVVPITYGPDHYVAKIDGMANYFTYNNLYSTQPLRVIIQNMPNLSEYGSGENKVLLDPSQEINLNTEGSGPLGRPRTTSGLTLSLAPSNNEYNGEKSFQVTAINSGSVQMGWGCAEIILDRSFNLTNNRAVGTWVYGDGSNTYLHFVLEDSGRWRVRVFWVKLNFEGWRYVEIPESAKGEVYDFAYPYSNYWAIRGINYSNISRVYVFITHLASGKKANCFFTRLEALKETPMPLKNPAISISGQIVTFPVTLEPDAYLEFMGDGIVKTFDANGFDAGKATISNTVSVNSVRSRVKFTCDENEGYSTRANVTIITYGDILPVSVEDDELPLAYNLKQNYPNPFNPSTTIEFLLPKGGFVTLKVYNIMGSVVATLLENTLDAGTHSVRFNASGLATGIYFYRLITPGFDKAKRMLLVK